MNKDSQRYHRAIRVDCVCVCLRVGYVGYLSSQACPGGGEIDFSHHRNSIRGDKRGGIPCCQEQTEVLIVINNLVSYLNHISRTCVWTGRKRQRVTYRVVTLNPFFTFTLFSTSCLLDVCSAVLPCLCLPSFFNPVQQHF